jgi:SAM-dependent methyltransferase
MLRVRLLQLAWWAGCWRPPDRVMLEDVILPHCGAAGGPVLFVGVRFYTRRYAGRCAGAEFITLDRDSAMRRYGARHHVVAALEDSGAHFPAGHFAQIVVNGVFGWGLDEPAAADRALAACHVALRPGGLLVLGLNEERAQTPAIDRLPALARFQPVEFAPLGRHRVVMPTPFAERSHTYLFYRRAPAG